MSALDRRRFAAGALAATGLATGLTTGLATPVHAAPAYRGPNVVIIRFGGGVRRRETVETATTWAPYLMHRLAPQGVMIPDLTIAQLDGVDTSHAEGTLNILTGRYRAYHDLSDGVEFDRLEPTEPTLFEYFRRAFDIPAHQALLINGEDRLQEEFLSYGIHPSHGIAFKSEVLSLYRFKLWSLRDRLARATGTDAEIEADTEALVDLEAKGMRGIAPRQPPEIEALWARWRAFWGDSGLKNPRGDAALTELGLWALRDLRPRLMMINYQDPDYVHWGNASHYTRAIARIDHGIERIVTAVATDEEYAGNTVFCIVPDCGRDANPLMSVPFQHHFNTRSAHEIFAFLMGPGIERGRVLDRPVDQTVIAPTIAAAMGFRAGRAENRALGELFT
ncbi:MAG: hypothetical protein AAF899_10625 [Pseudomonadota bacterium]